MSEKTIREIKEEYQAAALSMLPDFVHKYEADERAGVVKLVRQAQKKIDELQAEHNRIYQMSAYERQYAEYPYICGIDEAGRGPLAGPVVAGAVILPKKCEILYINDSKQLSEKKREELYEIIVQKALAWGVGMASPQRIDEINILQATYEAMQKAINNLAIKPDILLNDAVIIPDVYMKQVQIIKGDAKSISIAAASILAKVTRDRLMREYDRQFPGYGFAIHKGYGTKAHIEALTKLGPSKIHRNTFLTHFI